MLKLAKIFQAGMVLQREKTVRIWGTADAGAKITVTFQGQQAQTEADHAGNFAAETGPLAASGAETLTVSDGREEIRLENIAVGEVWIAGGQSNMEFFMEYEKHISREREQCENPAVRFYDVPKIAFEGQEEAFDYSSMGVWRKADPKEIGYFSAVGYYFEKELNRELKVPVGIVGCSWGGTRIASWMDPETVKQVGPFWMDMFEKESAGVDQKEYFEQQKTLPFNDRGALLDNPFMKFMLPKTHSWEENLQFLKQLGEAPDTYTNMLVPQNFPGSLYEHMVKSVAGFAVRGVLWYQGESDDEAEGGQKIYGDMLTGMIGDWRKLWGEELPFLIVQLPGWERWLANENHDYAAIREEQKKVTESVKGTWLCSIGDVGEQFDIHPKDKMTVGIRLSLLALGHIYGRNILCDAPDCAEAKREDGKIILTFSNAGDGMEIRGGQLNALEIGSRGSAPAFQAETKGDQVILTFEKLPEDPVQISFAQGAWYQINLFNSAGIPAIPFQVSV